jgi:TonB family protein
MGNSFGAPCIYRGPVSQVDLANGAVGTKFTYLVTTEGDLADVAILSGNGNDAIDDAAMRCISKWRANAGGPDVAEAVGPHWATIHWSAGTPVHFPADSKEVDLALTSTFEAGSGPCPSYYPPRAMRLGEEGATTVQFHVEADGSVRDASVFVSSGYRDLDNASIACAKFWRYQPSMKDGKPIEVLRSATIRWQIRR